MQGNKATKAQWVNECERLRKKKQRVRTIEV